MFAGSKNVVVAGGTFVMQGDFHSHTYVDGSGERGGLRVLQKNIATGAFHNSSERYDPPKCHPKTREAVLKKIMDWIKDPDKLAYFLWLYGPAGSGKSAIAQTIAEMCYAAGLLAATFFFSRTVTGRNEKTHLVSTIVYQMLLIIPEIREQVITALEFNPQILNLSLQAQLQELIINPLNFASRRAISGDEKQKEDFLSRPRFIIIDGLDECNDPEAQSYILDTLIPAVQNATIPLFFLIASRPEQQIRDTFNEDLLSSLTTTLVLDDTYRPDKDIRVLLDSRFTNIKKKHPARAHIPKEWPLGKEIDQLVEKSSGQFIYTTTVIKYIESRRHLPTDRLKIILGLSDPGNDTPFAELDALYNHILTSTYDQEKVIRLFMVLLVTGRDIEKKPTVIEKFLFLKPGEIDIILSDLHSLIAVPSFEDQKSPLRISHASLSDFLLDRSRSGKFFIDAGPAHAEILIYVLQHFEEDKGKQQECYQWSRLFDAHYGSASPIAKLLDKLLAFDLQSLLNYMIDDVSPSPDSVRPSTGCWSKVHVDDRWPNMARVFHWLRALRHPNPEIDFHKFYQNHFDEWLHTQLGRYYPVSEQSTTHLLAAVSLPVFEGDAREIVFDLINSISPWKDYDTLTWKDPLRLYSQYYAKPHSATYYEAMRGFLTDISRGREYYISDIKYGNFARIVLDYFFTTNPILLTAKDSDSYSTYKARLALKIFVALPDKLRISSDTNEYLQARSVRCQNTDNPLHDEMNSLADKIACFTSDV